MYSPRVQRQFPGLQRLISFALANPGFADRLIADPIGAMRQAPASLELTAEEYELLAQARGTASITDFAAYLDALIQDAYQGGTDDSDHSERNDD